VHHRLVVEVTELGVPIDVLSTLGCIHNRLQAVTTLTQQSAYHEITGLVPLLTQASAGRRMTAGSRRCNSRARGLRNDGVLPDLGRDGYGRIARGYLCYLESGGIFDMDAADAGTVLSFLASLSPRWAKTSLFWVSRTSGRFWHSPAEPT